MIMPVAQAVKRGLCFRKAVTALYAEDRIFLRKTALLPAGRREALDLFSTPVPADLSPEDAAGVGLGDALGWEPAVRFVAELPPGPGAPERLHLFRCVLPKGAAALPAGRGLSPFDADELSGIATQSPELFSQDLLRALAAGLLFP